MSVPDEAVDPRMAAAVDMLRRTGAQSLQVRYSDDEQPVVWFAVVEHLVDKAGVPKPKGTNGARRTWETAAGHDGTEALLRLCERIIDGGRCAHCGKVASFVPDLDNAGLLDVFTCVTQWDPELATFRRSCEGET